MKTVKYLIVIFWIIFFVVIAFLGWHAKRVSTILSIHQVKEYDDGFGIYEMNVGYDYNLDNILAGDIRNDADFIHAVIKEVLPGVPIKYESPQFGCSAFSTKLKGGSYRMGRNYDFRNNTSAMIIHNSPKDGYRSVSIADLNFINAIDASNSLLARIKCLAAPFAVLDGINEKGVSIAVLMTDSPSTHQDSGKPDLPTPLAIRLVLDRAATTKEAVELLSQYDMYAVSGCDYHFYVSDAGGNGCVVDYDPCSAKREMMVTPIAAVTNFYTNYTDSVLPNRHNGIYGHGKERYERIMTILNRHKGRMTDELAWQALHEASQTPKPGEATSNTQWSALYNNTDGSLEFVLRRHWADVYHFSAHNDNVK